MSDQPDFNNMSPEEIAEYQKNNCIFCKILKGEIPSKKAYEDDKMVSILDINPAIKGHLLVMPKEHYPIMPIIPPDVLAHMFKKTKEISKGVKEAIVTDKAVVFIANGGVAGQQSPHFLYHIIPDGGKLECFNIPVNEFKEEDVKKNLVSLKGKIGLFMKQLRGAQASVNSSVPAQQPQDQVPKSSSSGGQKALAEYIQDNPEIKNLIIKNPEEFKRKIEEDPKLKEMFLGIDIAKLSLALGGSPK